MYKYHKGSTQSIQQHARAMAGFLGNQQIKRTGKKFSSFKPNHHKHVGNKTKITLQQKETIKAMQIKIYGMARKINKLNQQDVIL